MFKWHWEALQTLTNFQIIHSSPIQNKKWIRKTLLARKQLLGISINFQDYFFLHSSFDWNPLDQSTRDICVLSVRHMFLLNKQQCLNKAQVQK